MASNTLSMSAPVCLVENGEDGKLHVNRQSLELLGKIEQQVVVVSVVGLYRTGKSYLMNKLARTKKGFSLGSTIQSHTKGIWMWCVPHPTKPDHTLVLLDTEGLGDVEKGDEKNDNWIFSLAVLLSSTLVYNSTGTINNNALQQLHYVTELTEHIRVKSQTRNEEDNSAEFARFFPSFVWTVRDFTLELAIDGKVVTADQYLDNALKLRPGTDKKSQGYNLPRECIRNYFPSRKCFVFTRPTTPEKMRLMEELSDTDLDPCFVQQAKDFCHYVFTSAQTKTMKGGYTVTGRLLGSLAETYVEAIRSGQIPCLDNAILALAEIQNTTALKQAVSYYVNEMNKWVAYPTETQEELSEVHGQFEKEAVKMFINHSFKDEDQKYQIELMKSLQNEYVTLCVKNEEASRKACSDIIDEVFQIVEKNLSAGSYMVAGGYNKFKTDMDEYISIYMAMSDKGVKAEEVLKEYLAAKESIGRAILAADKSLSEAERRIEEEWARSAAAERDRRAEEEKKWVLQRQIQDQERTYRENMEQLLAKMERDRKNLLKEQDNVLEAKLKEQRDLLEQGFRDRADRMDADIKALKREKEETESKSQSIVSTVVETVGNVASLFLPGIVGKAVGIGSRLLSRFF
ncbi:GBP1 protein, partial [Atractosteus spatula]|nr:GBP1 protein [Atractosteus spatula]